MTQDEVMDVARQASKEWLKELPTPWETANQVPKRYLEIFAKLVEDAAFVRWAAQTKLAVQEEREACAKVCDWMQEKAEFHGTDCCKFPTPTDCAHVIRARGEA